MPLDGVFTYSVPTALAEQVKIGVRVLVPFGRSKTYVGIIAKTHKGPLPSGMQIKDVLQVLDPSPILLDSQLRLWQWIADYYMSPIGEVYKAALPSGLKAEDGYRPKTETYIRLTPQFRSEQALHIAIDMLQRAPKQQKAFIDFLDLWSQESGDRSQENTPATDSSLQGNLLSPDSRLLSPVSEITRDELLNQGHSLQTITALIKRGLLETYEQEVGRLNHGGEPHLDKIQPLSPVQQDAYNQIQFSFLKKNVTLLHGVTSSGKTEIYIHLIRQALVGIYHSKYSDAERVEIWQKQLSGHPYDVILGARSAVFLPFQNLGLVIIDEEHETSYKQQDPAPRYHARSAAIMLAQILRRQESGVRRQESGVRSQENTPAVDSSLQGNLLTPDSCLLNPRVLLGTATPSLETYHNAKTGKYGLVELTERYKGIQLPEIQVVDIKDLQHRKMMNGPFSPLLFVK